MQHSKLFLSYEQKRHRFVCSDRRASVNLTPAARAVSARGTRRSPFGRCRHLQTAVIVSGRARAVVWQSDGLNRFVSTVKLLLLHHRNRGLCGGATPSVFIWHLMLNKALKLNKYRS